MNKFAKLLPFLYILLCALPTLFGFGIISAVLLCGTLAAYFVKNSPLSYVALLVFSGIAMFFALYGDVYYLAGYMATIAAVSLSLGICIKGKKTLTGILITASMCTLAIFLAIIVYYMKKYGISAVEAVFGTHLNTIKEAAPLTGEAAPQIMALVSAFEKQLDLLLPSLIVMASALLSYVSLGIARQIVEKNSKPLDIRPFYLLRLSSSFTFIFIIADMVSMFLGANILFANVSAVLTSIFVVCGISVIDFHLRMKAVKPFIRAIIYVAAFVLITFTGFFGTIAVNILHFVGLIDSLRPLRRIDSDKF